MHPPHILRLTLAAFACAGAVRLAWHASVSSPEDNRCDNPEARDQYEWMRLKDPATDSIPENIRARELAFARSMRLNAAMSPSGSASAVAEHAWLQRGPSNVGGRTRALALDINSDAVIIAGGVTGGVWRSVDTGATWVRTTPLDDLPSVSCIAQDVRPGKTHVWYYGTGEYRTNVQRFGNALYYGNGMYKSVDSGKHWTHLDATTGATNDQSIQPFDYVWKIAVDPVSIVNDVVYAAVFGGIMRSTNGGNSWSAVLGGNGNQSAYTTIEITSTGILYAALSTDGATHGVWRSIDGLQWTNITPATFPDSMRGVVLAVAPSDEHTMYLLAETPGAGMQVPSSYRGNESYSIWKYTYGSGDGSGTSGAWEDRSYSIPPYSNNGYVDYFNGLDSYALALQVSPTDASTVYLGGTCLYRTTDGFSTTDGTSWIGGYHADGSWTYDGALHPDMHTVVCARKSAAVFVGSDGGVFRLSAPGAKKWTPLNTGYTTTQFYSTAIDHGVRGSQTVIGGLQDNGTYGTSTPGGLSAWTMLDDGDGCFCAISDSEKAMVVSYQFALLGRRMRDTNGNIYTVNIFPGNWFDARGQYLFVNPIAMDPSNNDVLYVPWGPYLNRNDNYRATDAYAHWIQMFNSHSFDQSWITAVGVSKSNPAHRVYLGTASGQVLKVENANIGDPAPTYVTGAFFPRNAYINCIAVDPDDGNTAMVVFSSYGVQSLFVTSDGGESWSSVSGNLEQNRDGSGDGPSCRWAAMLHRGGERIWFVATSIGLFSTAHLNGDQTVWIQEGASSIGNAIVSMIDVRQSDGLVAVATWGQGMYTATISTTNVEYSTQSNQPRATILAATYPNPAKEQATLSISLQSTQMVSIDLLASNGNVLSHGMNGTMAAGDHHVSEKISMLPCGVYWWRINAGGNLLSKQWVKE